ncbi:farnesyltransferase beta subunit ram1 [Grosmannia clavigera kw1407]|uniref:Protein farnesyltransferase subunit beta n=1 Tax=Grosmannia clavigera (strain kw1407 / UAMH 11150) TaxID=655863 RepID=F0XHM5_GROCL|nr:farnesyltransferase beta subunit ram1 [Grosmannia clavigera kw1407]EFX02793.1 farnesyltransferase beta subunit ram1 [Grosmannia clavigera kw1407]
MPATSTTDLQQLDPTDVDEEIVTHSSIIGSYKPVLIEPSAMIADIFTRPPLVRDVLLTDTSDVQDETVQLCLPFMDGQEGQDGLSNYNDFGVPSLDRQRHIKFLKASLGTLPGSFVSYDASRPWLLYWCLNGLTLLGEDVTVYRQRLVDTARSMQNASGGFGSGHGQVSHLATTYAIVLSLAIVGGQECYDVVDRRGLWKWLCALKQPDGGFQMSIGAEVDRPGLAKYVQRCQTYEGGISSQPGSEAHGGYAFCALGCLSILDSPDRSISRYAPSESFASVQSQLDKNQCMLGPVCAHEDGVDGGGRRWPQDGRWRRTYLDVQRLVSWLSSRQYAPEGGFSGRTNKLVDGCYSHWVGSCWPLVEACLGRSEHENPSLPSRSLFSREGLIRYILCCCQDQTKRGGLRDKPARMSDPYHTCYVLSGLSSAQHKWELVAPEGEPALSAGDTDMPASPTWLVSPFVGDDMQVFEEADRVNTLHPVYAIPADCVARTQEFFRAKAGF